MLQAFKSQLTWPGNNNYVKLNVEDTT